MSSELVEDPVLRQRYRFARDGDILRVDVWAEPGSAVPDHFHPRLEERWEVVEGTVTFRVDGDERPAGPGDRLVAPAGVRHSFENTGSQPAYLLVEVEPPLMLQEFLEEGAALNRTGGFTERGIPKGLRPLLQGADFTQRYRDTTVLTFPPPAVQRILFTPLARLARRRNRKAAA
jgi:mannose-6-phosphate isomerase-like protein (cupin superfamily)